MRDREVVASITAGDPVGLATAYDRYAPQLFAYCRSMLREPADAADAVQDTFVIAAARLRDLREPDRLRAWLYAVARNVCLRKLRADKAAATIYPAPDSAADPADSADSAEVGGRVELAELRALVRDAAGGLSARDREVLVLRLWQGLDPAETSTALGVSRGYANALFARARTQLEICIGVLLVARSGRRECAGLRATLDDWDGHLTVLLRKRLSRHVENCATCAERRRRELVPALLGVSPGAAIAAAAAADAARHAKSLPAITKGKALALGPRHGHAAAVASRMGPFGKNGFPKGPHLAATRLARGSRGQVTAAGGAAAAVAAAAVGLGLALPGGAPHGRLASGAPPGPGASGPAAPGPGTTGPGGVPPGATAPGGHARGGQSPQGGSGTGGHGPAGGAPGLAGGAPRLAAYPESAGPGPGGAGGPGGSGGGASGGPGPGSGGPTAPPSAPATSRPPASSPPTTAPPTTSAPATPPPPPPPSSPPPPPPPPPSSPPPAAPGTLALSPTTVVLTPLLGQTLTLTADHGPVTWSISEPSSLLGALSVSPSSGTLAAGQRTRITISVIGLASLATNLQVNPGGLQVHVVLGLGL